MQSNRLIFLEREAGKPAAFCMARSRGSGEGTLTSLRIKIPCCGEPERSYLFRVLSGTAFRQNSTGMRFLWFFSLSEQKMDFMESPGRSVKFADLPGDIVFRVRILTFAGRTGRYAGSGQGQPCTARIRRKTCSAVSDRFFPAFSGRMACGRVVISRRIGK